MEREPKYFDLDQKAAFEYCQSRLESPGVSNFAVEFNDESARCATSLSPQNVAHILKHRQHTEFQNQCLWLNLWGWSTEHHEIIKMIAHDFDVSPRLAHMISPKPSAAMDDFPSQTNMPPVDSSSSDDLEKAESTFRTVEIQAEPKGNQLQLLRGIGDVVDNLWHFYSLGFGNRHVSISWNGLFFVPSDQSTDSSNKPNAIRIWSSLLLCDDGTIVSVFECPQNCPPEIIKKIRFNQLNIFCHLTKLSQPHMQQNPLMQISVRSPNNRSRSSTMELAGLMLYYLFDDWVNIYAQVAGGSASYRHRLDQIRQQMISSADVDQVKTLHSLGRQLTTLKLIYRSYQAIIERLIQRLRTSGSHNTVDMIRSSDSLSRVASLRPHDSIVSLPNSNLDLDETQVRLSPNIIARFERLLDRIGICALTEVEECLKEKEAMVLMNFSLIQLTESRSVEKLTRTTILLAKVTILFLPLNLVSGYFSLQFAAIDELYSLRTFWLSFMVVAIVTLAFLIGSSFVIFSRTGKASYREHLIRAIPGQRVKKA